MPGGRTIKLDFGRRLKEQPGVGHNRWHEGLEPVVEVRPGELLTLDMLDGFDNQVTPGMSPEQFSSVSFFPNHPMTGPVAVTGAQPGDLLEVEIVDVEPDPHANYGFTPIAPGFGLLRDRFSDAFIAHWQLCHDGYARSEEIPYVRVPRSPFLGILGVAPSRQLREHVTRRESSLLAAGGTVLPPDPREAVPAMEPYASEALRTIPPRENGGNLDVKQARVGSRVLLPVFVPGAMFSAGDPHYAQGDGESCGCAIEMRGRARLRFRVLEGAAENGPVRNPVVILDAAADASSLCVVGYCVEEGKNHSESTTVAARQAVLNLIDILAAAGWSREQAYVICSVAADLRIGQIVDLPNVGVTAVLPLNIFEEPDRIMRAIGGQTVPLPSR